MNEPIIPAVNAPDGMAFATASAAPALAIPNYRLYDPTSVGLAAFFGSPIAGTVLMAINYRHLGRKSSAILAVILGVAATALAIAIEPYIPSTFTSVAAIALFVGTYNAAKTLQGPIVEKHELAGGSLHSRWAAFGISLAVLAAGFAIIVAAVLPSVWSSKVVIGSKDIVEYSGAATKADATALGQALKKEGYFQDRGASVLLSKNASGVTISFVVKDDVPSHSEMVYVYETVGFDVAPSVAALPVKLQFVSARRELLKEFTVGRATIGSKDQIYFSGSATDLDATALGQSFVDQRFFRDTGANVFFTKDGAVTSIGYILPEGNWNRPDQISALEEITRTCAAKIGGLPITVRLLSQQLELKKEEVVN